MFAGPSEVTIIADKYSNPKWIAADLIAQAEHDELAQSILVTENKELIYKVKKLLENEISSFISTGIEWIPTIFIDANENSKDEILSFLENLEEDDDVQNVYSNVKFKN